MTSIGRTRPLGASEFFDQYVRPCRPVIIDGLVRKRLGFKGAKYTAWNMTHHMQSGWVEGGAPHLHPAAPNLGLGPLRDPYRLDPRSRQLSNSHENHTPIATR